MKIHFKAAGGNRQLVLNVVGKEGNGWLKSIVHFDNYGFTARFHTVLTVYDLQRLEEQLTAFQQHLHGTVTFSSIEGSVDIIITTDGLGHLDMSGTLRHPLDPDLRLVFNIRSDQTFLPSLISERRQVLLHYTPLH